MVALSFLLKTFFLNTMVLVVITNDNLTNRTDEMVCFTIRYVIITKFIILVYVSHNNYLI